MIIYNLIKSLGLTIFKIFFKYLGVTTKAKVIKEVKQKQIQKKIEKQIISQQKTPIKVLKFQYL